MTRMQLKAKLGLVRKEFERSLLLVGDTPAAFEALRATISMIEARDSRIKLILSSTEPDVLAWLRQQFPTARVLPLPFSNRLSTGLYLRRLNIRAVAFAEAGKRTANLTLLAVIKQSAIGVVTLSARGPEYLPTAGPLMLASEALVVIVGYTGKQPRSNGEMHLTEAETANMLAAMLARDLKALRDDNSPGRVAAQAPLKLVTSPRWRGAIAWRARRFQDGRELKERLASPKVILCLGNGPSSEYPMLENMKFDSLFRVNHSWLKRKGLVNPNVVFTGGRPTMRAVSGSIFGLQTPDAEGRLMLARAYNPLVGRTEFFNVNDVTASLKQFNWGHLRPTNGASMLATAVALNPEKLIVAGIDLFQHPEGSYPGDMATLNAYSPGHSRETELNYILQLFSEFRGEIIIVGDILRTHWEHCKQTTKLEIERPQGR